MKKYQKQLLSLLAGTVLGYLLYYHFFMDVILLIAHEGFLYMIINIAMLLLSIVGCAAIIYLLLEKRVSRWMLVLLSVTYFIALFIILFCRHRVGRIAILNPLVGLSQLGDWEMLMQSLLNLLMFLPMGFFFRNRKPMAGAAGGIGHLALHRGDAVPHHAGDVRHAGYPSVHSGHQSGSAAVPAAAA